MLCNKILECCKREADSAGLTVEDIEENIIPKICSSQQFETKAMLVDNNRKMKIKLMDKVSWSSHKMTWYSFPLFFEQMNFSFLLLMNKSQH